MGTRTERRVALLRAVVLGIAEKFDDAETSEEGRGHLRANVEKVLDLLIDAIYEDAAFDAAVVNANAMTRMLYGCARTCYDAGRVEASMVLQRMAAAAFQQQRELFDGPRRGPLVDVIGKFFDDHGPEGEMVNRVPARVPAGEEN
jgi:hypothetical protein